MKSEKKSEHCTVVSDSAIPWTAACPTPLSMEFSRQECWSGLPFHSPGDLPDLGIERRSPTLQADSLPAEPQGKPMFIYIYLCMHTYIMYIHISDFSNYRSLQDIEYNCLCYTVVPCCLFYI